MRQKTEALNLFKFCFDDDRVSQIGRSGYHRNPINEQLHHLQQCFQIYLIIKLEIFHILVKMFSKMSVKDLLYVEKG